MYRPALVSLCLLFLAACNAPYRDGASAGPPAARHGLPPAALHLVQEPLGTCHSAAIQPLGEAPLAGRRGDDSVWL